MGLRNFLLGLLLISVANIASAYTGTGGSQYGVMSNTTAKVPYYGWNVEGAAQLISMADGADAMLGSALYYRLTDFFDVGVQTLMSVNKGGNSTVRVAARQYFTEGRTALFFQPALGYNLHREEANSSRAIETGSLSVDVGVKHRIYRDVHIGATSGLELVDKGRYYKSPEAERQYMLTPRLALMTNVDF